MVATAGVCAGLALSGSAIAVAEPATGDGTQTNLLYSADGGATWSDSVTAQRGEQVFARLFYNTTKTTDVAGASLTTQIPDGFAYVPGSTRNVLAPEGNLATGTAGSGAKVATIADSVWSGGTLTVSPSAGFNGESNASQSGVLRTGIKRYLNLQECVFTYIDPTPPNDYDTRIIGPGGRSANSNVSNTADAAAACGPGSGVYTDLTQSRVRAIDLLGNRYLNLHQCNYVASNAGTPVNNFDNRIVGAGGRSSGTNASNTPDTSPNCGTGDAFYTNEPSTFVAAVDLLGNRYLNLQQCVYSHADGQTNLFDSRWIGANRARTANTNASNTPDTTAACANTSGAYEGTVSNQVAALDLVDPARGTGYVQFTLTSEAPETPACGETVSLPEVSSTRTGTLSGPGTGAPASSADVTLAAFEETGDACSDELTANLDEETTPRRAPIDIDVLANDDVPDGVTVEVSGPTSGPSGGSVVLNEDGTFTYTPDDDFWGTDTFTYTITDEDGNSSVGTVRVTVTENEDGTPLVAPGAALVAGLLGAGLLGLRRRREAASH